MIMSRRLPKPVKTALAALGTLLTAGLMWPTLAEAKTPGSTYCFHGVCHRVKSLAETERLIGRTEVATTSFYDDCKRDRYNPCGLTASGEVFRADRPDNAASPHYPNGTKLLVWNGTTQQAAVIRINNAGPYWGSRTLDLSRAAAEHLGFARKGVARLHIKVISAPSKAEATYSRNRSYPVVPGPIGKFESIETALLEMGRPSHNLFASPVHAVAGRQTPQEARAFAEVERRKVTVMVAASLDPKLQPARSWMAGGGRGTIPPVRSARAAEEQAMAALPMLASFASDPLDNPER